MRFFEKYVLTEPDWPYRERDIDFENVTNFVMLYTFCISWQGNNEKSPVIIMNKVSIPRKYF